MADLTKIVITLSDGTTQEFDAAVPALPTQVVDVTAGESVEVVNTDAPATDMTTPLADGAGGGGSLSA